MPPKLLSATYIGGYKIMLAFSDGTAGEVDLESELWGEVFEPLKDQVAFRDFCVHPELQTIVWSSGADFAPEFLYAQVAA